MSGPSPGDKPVEPPASTGAEDRIEALGAYFVAHAGQFTPEALRQAASGAGYSPDEVEEAWRRGAAVSDTHLEAFRQIRSRARWIVLASYALVFAALAILLLGTGGQYGAGVFALAILAPVLGVTLLVAIVSVNRRRPPSTSLEGALGAILIVPMVLLVAVAGLCIASTQSLRGP